MSHPSRRVVAVAAAVLVAVVTAPAGIGYATLHADGTAAGVLPASTTVGGVDVSGLDRAAAVAAVRRIVERNFDRAATLQVGRRTYTTDLRSLGAGDDAETAVETAFRQSRRGTVSRFWDRLSHRSGGSTVPVRVDGPQPGPLQAIVSRAVREAAVEPVSAGVSLRGGWLRFTRATTGRRLDPVVAADALRASLRDGLTHVVAPVTVSPEVADTAFDTVVLVRTGENRLYVYQGARVARVFAVATGSPDFPTPTGHFHVEAKRYLPTWTNPHPDEGWGKLEPATIAPGPANPLGTRAMNLDVPNIRIHGTPAAASVGYSASHGCIRMRMPDVEALYPMVPTGTSVFVTSAGPPKLPPPGARVSVASLAEGG